MKLLPEGEKTDTSPDFEVSCFFFETMSSEATGEENAITKKIQNELKHELIRVVMLVFQISTCI